MKTEVLGGKIRDKIELQGVKKKHGEWEEKYSKIVTK
jgi:hypothetical protein